MDQPPDTQLPQLTQLTNVKSKNQMPHQSHNMQQTMMPSQQQFQRYPTQHTQMNTTQQYQIDNRSPDVLRPVAEYYMPTPPRCQLQCRCCAMQTTYGLVCSCNQPKESVATQTEHMLLHITADDYFTPKTTAYRLLQSQITTVLSTNKLTSTTNQDFENCVSDIISFVKDLPDTPRTREKVRTRFRKRMYNQNGYEKTKELSRSTGVSVKKLQWKAEKKAAVTVPNKQPRKEIDQVMNVSSSSEDTSVNSPGPSTAVPENSVGISLNVGDCVYS